MTETRTEETKAATAARKPNRTARATALANKPADVPDAAAAADASVLDGVGPTDTQKAEDAKAAPRPRAGKGTAKAAPAKAAPAEAAPAAKTGPGKAEAAKAAAAAAAKAAKAATTAKADHKTDLAREFAELLTKHFADATPEDKDRIAYWARCAPTGKDAETGKRWWPANFPRPTTVGWE